MSIRLFLAGQCQRPGPIQGMTAAGEENLTGGRNYDRDVGTGIPLSGGKGRLPWLKRWALDATARQVATSGSGGMIPPPIRAPSGARMRGRVGWKAWLPAGAAVWSVP